jgi:maleamate amidohydrolase
MSDSFFGAVRTMGAPDLQLPAELREPLLDHLESLRVRYTERSWAKRVGFGRNPALLVIDLALFWTRQDTQMGSNLDNVVDSTCELLDAARRAGIPVIFTTFDYNPGDSSDSPNGKAELQVVSGGEDLFKLDPRLQRQATEPLIFKRAASSFKDTNLDEMLTALGVDTLIVTGASTSHCVYATCRDATNSYRVIVPREAVGDRCEIMHLVNLLDIDIDVGDVLPSADVVALLSAMVGSEGHSTQV